MADKTNNSKRLSDALKALKKVQDKQHGIAQSKDFTLLQRTVLLETGFLRPVMKGWYICCNPSDQVGDSTAWYANYWHFISRYLQMRFGNQYFLNPEASLLLHTGNTTVPKQITIVTKNGSANIVKLPFNTSLMIYSDQKRVSPPYEMIQGLQVLSLPESLCYVGPHFFTQYPTEAEIALAMVRDLGKLLVPLVTGNCLPTAAARLAGALIFTHRPDDAHRVIQSMAQAGHKIYPHNPFQFQEPSITSSREKSPYVLRLRSMWAKWRTVVADHFPLPPVIPPESQTYLNQIDERYIADAYNSLSIEGYHVTDELIERFAKNGWNPDQNQHDDAHKDALAAHGYFLAFQSVKQSILKILSKSNSGEVVRKDHHEWYATLFNPIVWAGILERHQLVGYRNGPVFIKNSLHTPLPKEALIDCMEALFDLIAQEPEARVRAVLGHHLFVFIHPYFDGNGRIGRFLMNALLASEGYPWTIVRMSQRNQYMAALEKASVEGDILPLTQFLAQEMSQ